MHIPSEGHLLSPLSYPSELGSRFVFSHVIAWLSVRRSKSDQQPAGRGAPPPSR